MLIIIWMKLHVVNKFIQSVWVFIHNVYHFTPSIIHIVRHTHPVVSTPMGDTPPRTRQYAVLVGQVLLYYKYLKSEFETEFRSQKKWSSEKFWKIIFCL